MMPKSSPRLLPEERRRDIENLVRREGSVKIETLVKKYQVTRMTIWRDLSFLAEQNLLDKVHGGAIKKAISVTEPLLTLSQRKITFTLQKQLIASYAARNYVQNDQTLFLDSGTTVIEMIPHLDQENLVLITNGIETLFQATRFIPHFSLFTCGGKIATQSFSLIGEEANNTLKKYTAACFFFSVPGIDIEKGACEADPHEYTIKQTMFQQAKKRILLADSSKFGKRLPHIIADIKSIDVIISDENLPNQVQRQLKNEGVIVEIATMKDFLNNRKKRRS